jgi:hypothetical protein
VSEKINDLVIDGDNYIPTYRTTPSQALAKDEELASELYAIQAQIGEMETLMGVDMPDGVLHGTALMRAEPGLYELF